jgi:hypothetical protein
VIHVIDTVILPPVKPKEYLAGMAGISLPFGGGPFDPLGFTEGQTVAEIKRLRESELIHGRVCMLAAVGILVGEKFNPLFDGSITGLAIDHWQQVPAGFEGVVTLAIGIAEAGRANKGWVEPGNGLFQLREGYAPGDLGFDPLGLLPTAAPVAKEMATKELNNGRLAMLATAGMVMQELVTGKTIAEQMNWCATVARASRHSHLRSLTLPGVRLPSSGKCPSCKPPGQAPATSLSSPCSPRKPSHGRVNLELLSSS